MFDLAQFFAWGGKIDLGQLFPIKPLDVDQWPLAPEICCCVWVGVGWCMCMFCFCVGAALRVRVWVLVSRAGCSIHGVRVLISSDSFVHFWVPWTALRVPPFPRTPRPFFLSSRGLWAAAARSQRPRAVDHNSTRRPPQKKRLKLEVGEDKKCEILGLPPSGRHPLGPFLPHALLLLSSTFRGP